MLWTVMTACHQYKQYMARFFPETCPLAPWQIPSTSLAKTASFRPDKPWINNHLELTVP